MHYAIDYHSISINLKQNSVTADAQSKPGCEVSQALHITSQVVLKSFDSGKNSPAVGNAECL
jgi:hypothetical protein